ncbi:hypothetical protein F0P96_04830 [Hymenobacter busanensis]|uniref:Uncharacterized protein n=1 Tax=Hymenobacter busanensis TaxID=2607656 RepID=A0A7L5A4Y5_9BACT|nr:hypothetical protein [Hymenobacter busanensis]KAA9338175.1 hypothetical protein F0P96_04830 [Hymenobacter busanensis]QHJ09400.1 hypothetical protein GUY19_19780 [Hymenobacter busanensis]
MTPDPIQDEPYNQESNAREAGREYEAQATASGQPSSEQDRQPQGRYGMGDRLNLQTGENADDNTGSGGNVGGRETTGRSVSRGTEYDAPGNAADGDVGGSTTSAGTGTSAGQPGAVTGF